MRKTLLAAVLLLTLCCTAFGQTDNAEFEAASIKPEEFTDSRKRRFGYGFELVPGKVRELR